MSQVWGDITSAAHLRVVTDLDGIAYVISVTTAGEVVRVPMEVLWTAIEDIRVPEEPEEEPEP